MDLTTERVPVARMPWRAMGLVALLALLLAASLAVYIGSQPRLPDPFGLASNGLVAYSTDGDIYTGGPGHGSRDGRGRPARSGTSAHGSRATARPSPSSGGSTMARARSTASTPTGATDPPHP